MLLCLECVEERRPFLVLGHKIDVAIEFFDNELADYQPQSYAIGVYAPIFIFL